MIDPSGARQTRPFPSRQPQVYIRSAPLPTSGSKDPCPIKGISEDTRILILGCTFKENCPDLRNSKVFDVYKKLSEIGIKVDIWDPNIDSDFNHPYYDAHFINAPKTRQYDAMIVAVAHDEFLELGASNIRKLGKAPSVLFDVKSVFEIEESDLRL